jgi:hypothetical protein
LGRETGDAINGFGAVFLVNDFGSVALDTKDPGRMRKGEIASQFGTGPDMTDLQTPVDFIGGGVVRGEKTSSGDPQCPGGESVDCL